MAVIARKLADLKFKIMATKGTAQALRSAGIDVIIVDKHHEGEENALTLVKKGEINLNYQYAFRQKKPIGYEGHPGGGYFAQYSLYYDLAGGVGRGQRH